MNQMNASCDPLMVRWISAFDSVSISQCNWWTHYGLRRSGVRCVAKIWPVGQLPIQLNGMLPILNTIARDALHSEKFRRTTHCSLHRLTHEGRGSRNQAPIHRTFADRDARWGDGHRGGSTVPAVGTEHAHNPNSF